MNRKLFYILLAVIGVSSALPVGQEHGDINDLSANGYVPADGYVPAENTELNEEDLSDRNKRQTKVDTFSSIELASHFYYQLLAF